MRIPPLKAIIAFESVARTKSVNRAAEELGLTASAVSHQLSNLESIIGQPLFQRSGRGLALTPTGERYLADVTGSLADLSRATERASSRREVDILRVHSSPSFGLMWLLPRLSSFQEANGDIQLNLACSYEDISFSNGYYDVDIRHGYGNWSNLEVRTIRGEYIAPLASPSYLERNPVHTPADLLTHRLIYSETPLVQWKQWFGRTGVPAAACVRSMRAMRRQGPLSSINWSFNLLDPAAKTRDGWFLAEAASDHADHGYSSERLRLWNYDGEQVLAGMQAAAIFG